MNKKKKKQMETDIGSSFADCAIVEIQVTIADEMKHADGTGKVEFNLLEEAYIVTIDRCDMVKSTEILTIVQKNHNI